jgi:hypothetical protein
LGPDPFSAEVVSYAIQPEGKALPSFQAAQTAIGLQEDFLRHVLSIVEVAEFSIHISIDAGFILVHKYTESSWLSTETFLDYAAIICSHFSAPRYPLI